jgi:putative membrane protein
MLYLYIKALHVIFVVTWFSGMFYIVRLFIYNTEASTKDEPARSVLHQQFQIMIRRLWLGITWPSAILTLIFGIWMWVLLGSMPLWLLIKLSFVLGLFAYHLSLHKIYRMQMRGAFKYSSNRLRIWNELATVFLVAIVMLAVVKNGMSWFWGLVALAALMILLMAAIRIYKNVRGRQRESQGD